MITPGPFAIQTGWIALAVAAMVIGFGGTPNEAGMAMMVVADVAVLIAVQRGEP